MLTSVLTANKISPVRTFAGDIAHARNTEQKTNVAVKVTTPTLTTQSTIPNIKVISAATVPPAIKVLTKSIPAADAAIPPFHTFSKSSVQKTSSPLPVTTIDTSAVAAPSRVNKPSVLTKPSVRETVGDGADMSEATVITDTKHKPYSLTAAVGTSVSTWFAGKKNELTTAKKPKYTLPEADLRKGVIQRATSQTGRQTTADHAEVLRRLRTSRATTKPNVAVATPVVPTIPVWESDTATLPATIVESIPQTLPTSISPLTQEQVETELAPVNKIIQPIIPATSVESAKISVPRILPNIPKIIAPVIAPLIETEALPITEIPIAEIPPIKEKPSVSIQAPTVKLPLPVTPIARERITPTIPRQLLTTVPLPTTPVLAPQSAISSIRLPQVKSTIWASLPTPPPTEIPKRTPITPITALNQQNQFWGINRLIIISIIGTTLLGSGGIGYLVYHRTTSNSESTPPSDGNLPTVTTGPTQHQITSSQDILDLFKNTTTEDTYLTELTLVSVNTNTILTAAEFFTLFRIKLPLSFTTAINQLRLGTYRGQPWIVVAVSDTPTGQGGMFVWEKTLAKNLEPLFATGTETLKFSTGFIDTSIDSKDVRVLKGSQDTNYITYGFITPNEILITSTDSAWLNLSQKLTGSE